MKSKDYVDSLQLKNDLVLYIYDMKDPLDSYVYFFEIRVANENSSPWMYILLTFLFLSIRIKRRYSDFAALSRNVLIFLILSLCFFSSRKNSTLTKSCQSWNFLNFQTISKKNMGKVLFLT